MKAVSKSAKDLLTDFEDIDKQALFDELAGIYEFEQNLSKEQAELNAKMDMIKREINE